MNEHRPQEERLRLLPKIDEILLVLERQGEAPTLSRSIVTQACRTVVADLRRRIREGDAALAQGVPDAAGAARLVRERLERWRRPHLRRVVNATGVILHTNLGRAPLCEEALASVRETARGYSNLEYDLEKGERGLRYDHVRELFCDLTGAEDALVVNNNAAAVLLALNTLAEGREAVVSRGELVEIGGEFRIPEVMRKSGVFLREVGATNRTRLRDYAEACGERTALILKVHPSNFRVVGFTEETDLSSLVTLGRERNLPVMVDLGSGCLIDLAAFGLEREPTVQEAIRSGADVVTFSGDKLLGGPQAGVILGKADALARIRRNPLNRALRIDKLTLAALEATVRLYADPAEAPDRLRTLRSLTEPLAAVTKRARRLLRLLRGVLPSSLTLELKTGFSTAGGGSLPTQAIATAQIAVFSDRLSPPAMDRALRRMPVPVVCRVEADRILLDLRTVEPWEFSDIRDGLAGLTRES